MGLDMYLYRRAYLGLHNTDEPGKTITIVEGLEIPTKNLVDIRYKVAYWRKANAIHKWFVKNVQDGIDDCGEYEVQKYQLEELLLLCKEVKEVLGSEKEIITLRYSTEKTEDTEVYVNRDKAAELLPTQEGFFFGTVEYNDWYMNDLDSTIEQLEKALNSKDIGKYGDTFFYTSSW